MDIGAKEFLTLLMRGYSGYDYYYLEDYYREFNLRYIDDEYKDRAIRNEVLEPRLLYKGGMVYLNEFMSVTQVDKNLRFKQSEKTFNLYVRCIKKLGDEIRRIEKGCRVYILEFIRVQSSDGGKDRYLALCRDKKKDIYYIATAKFDYIENGFININIINKPYKDILEMRKKVNQIVLIGLLKVLEDFKDNNRKCVLIDNGVSDMTITHPKKNYNNNSVIYSCDTSNIQEYKKLIRVLEDRLTLFIC